jgi:hypothetical protein
MRLKSPENTEAWAPENKRVPVRVTLKFHAGAAVPDSAPRPTSGAVFTDAFVDAPLPTRDP